MIRYYSHYCMSVQVDRTEDVFRKKRREEVGKRRSRYLPVGIQIHDNMASLMRLVQKAIYLSQSYRIEHLLRHMPESQCAVVEQE
jgi:hypothetical protein